MKVRLYFENEKDWDGGREFSKGKEVLDGYCEK